MPSVADLIFFAVLCVLLFTPLSVRLLGDAGIGWHIRTGQQILSTPAIPRLDPFSSTMEGRPWFAWEWLYDVLVGYLDARFGLNGPVWFTALIIAATFGALFHFLRRRDANLIVALLFVLLAISASMIHMLTRPHVLSWLLCVVWFWILASTESDSLRQSSKAGRKRLWALPLLMVLWVNVHGAFLVGFVLLAVFWASTLWTWWDLRQPRIEECLPRLSAATKLRQLTLIGLASLAASLINPYGWKLHQHIGSYLSDRFLMDHIEEFQSPNFHGIPQRCFLALILIAVALMGIRRSKLRISGVLTALFAIYAGLLASRNIPLAAILITMSIAPLVSDIPLFRGFAGRMAGVDSQVRGHLWAGFVVVMTGLIVAYGGRLGTSQLIDAHFDAKRMPVEAVDFLAAERIEGPILGPDYWGGYITYRLYPQQRVVVDDRHDLYGSGFMRSYLHLIHVEDGWDTFLRQTRPACLLLPRGSALANRIGQTRGWRSVYADSTAIAFQREAYWK